ncbi:hypothetical protein ACL1CX_11045 [Corynebacterium striatum]|nr:MULTISPECIES: hypothetical protein [unclassified Corynebacterium]CQD13964.1 conserved exported hypothetical protein [Corynebacterium striatum]
MEFLAVAIVGVLAGLAGAGLALLAFGLWLAKKIDEHPDNHR